MLIVCPSCATSYDVELGKACRRTGVRCAARAAGRSGTRSRATPKSWSAAAEALAPERADDAGVARRRCPRSADALAKCRRRLLAGRSCRRAPRPPRRRRRCRARCCAVDTAETDGYVPRGGRAADRPGRFRRGRSALRPRRRFMPTKPAREAARISKASRRGGSRAAARRHRCVGRCRGLQTGILALALIDTILIGWRSDVVRALPQTASFYAAARTAGELARSHLR